MSTYLITGGAGHIGSTLGDALIARGDSVVVVDNFMTGRIENVNPEAALVENPFGNFMDVAGILDRIGPFDGVFHLASSVGVNEVLRNPAFAVQNIINPAYDVCRWGKGIRTVLASSSEVYGTSSRPMEETDTLSIGPGPRWSYAAAKLATESLSPSLIVARIFNTIGPRQRSGVVPTFIDAALAGNPLIIHSSTARSFSCVKDTVSGLMTLMDKADPGIYNVGASNHESITSLAWKIREIVGSESAIVHGDKPQDDIYNRIPNLDKLKALGWSQQWDLDKTLRWIVAEKVRENADVQLR